MKGKGLNNHPSRVRGRRPVRPCGNRSDGNPGKGDNAFVCVLDRGHAGRCQGPALYLGGIAAGR